MGYPDVMPEPSTRPPRTHERRRPARGRRALPGHLARTILLGAGAVVFSIWWLARELGLDKAELKGFFLTSLLFVGLFVGLGLFGWGALWMVGRLRSALQRSAQGRSARNRSGRGA